MNNFEKELHGYINGTERMSGFDSYDSYEGDMSYFDNDDMSYFDGDDMSFASGMPGADSHVSDPYVLQYQNTVTSAGSLTAIIFGFNDYFGASNYGNPSFTITSLQGGTYGRMIAQTNNKPFKIGKMRFQSTNTTNLAQTVTINHVDANGKVFQTPLNLSILRDAYQYQSDIIDVTRPITVDGNTYLSMPIQNNSAVVISFFPTSLISPKARLNGGSLDNRARAPRLSGKNVSPVIIQTSQGVRGIAKG
jgi:hypothetical protein